MGREDVGLQEEARRKVELIRRRFDARPSPPSEKAARSVAVGEADRLDDEAKRLIATIRVRFPLRPIPKLDPSRGDIEQATLSKLVSRKTWPEVDGCRLIRNSDWLVTLVFDTDAFLYYLPSYMTTYLTYWQRALILWGHEPDVWISNYLDRLFAYLDLTNYVDTPEFFGRMDREQRECVLGFIEFFWRFGVLLLGENEFTLTLEGLADLWGEFLALPTIMP